jgi:hypothetical protein
MRIAVHFLRVNSIALVLLAFAVLPATAAQAPMAPGPSPVQPIANAVRIDAADAPAIDADLSDPAWARAMAIEDFWQAVPNTGAAATERTVVRVLYDEDNLYFGIYAYDQNPEDMLIRAMSRDGQIGTGETVRIIVDPGMTRRNGFTFQVGPSGGRIDAIIQNNNTSLAEWDTIWAVRTRVVEDGWIVEIAIPFRSLTYERDAADWGFELTRQIRHKNETVRWSNYSPNIDFTDISGAGTLRGISDVNEGVGLDVQIYGLGRLKSDWHIPEEDVGISGTAGATAFYRITPGFTGTLTVNPDFSDAPLDARQINTTRFSLFLPETRDFFLQDAPAFEFGGNNFSFENNGRPFFSRNIGLVDGNPVSIIAGGKLSGEYGGFGIGALSVLTDRIDDIDRQVLSVARITRPLFAESKVGFIITHGDPTGESENTVVGGDFQYRDSNFMGDYVFLADAYYERSFSSTEGDDDSYGLALEFPNEPFSAELEFREIGRFFEPALGFINRTGIREYGGELEYVWRFGDENFLREIALSGQGDIFTDLDDRVEEREAEVGINFETQAGDSAGFEIASTYEFVPEDFDIEDVLIVPAGEYRATNFGLNFNTSGNRIIQFGAEIECCDFYTGSGWALDAEVNFRPSQYFELEVGWESEFITLPTGSIDIHVLSADALVNFTPDMQLAMQLQYDNISKSFGFLARYRWEFRPGSELFAAFGQAGEFAGEGLSEFAFQRSTFLIRVGHTLRF